MATTKKKKKGKGGIKVAPKPVSHSDIDIADKLGGGASNFVGLKDKSGHAKMLPGGGDDIPKGQTWAQNPKSRRDSVTKGPTTPNASGQPRKSNGQFEYKSAVGQQRKEPYHAWRNGLHGTAGDGYSGWDEEKDRTLPEQFQQWDDSEGHWTNTDIVDTFFEQASQGKGSVIDLPPDDPKKRKHDHAIVAFDATQADLFEMLCQNGMTDPFSGANTSMGFQQIQKHTPGAYGKKLQGMANVSTQDLRNIFKAGRFNAGGPGSEKKLREMVSALRSQNALPDKFAASTDGNGFKKGGNAPVRPQPRPRPQPQPQPQPRPSDEEERLRGEARKDYYAAYRAHKEDFDDIARRYNLKHPDRKPINGLTAAAIFAQSGSKR